LTALAQAEGDTIRTLAVSLGTLRDEVRPLVTNDQLATLDRGIEKHGQEVRSLLGFVAAPCCRPTALIPVAELDRAVRALGLSAEARASVEGAVNRHLERTRVLATDRSGLLRRMAPVLTPEELADFAASLERHSAIVTTAGSSAR
jgi:hypothetical protein